MPYTPTILSPKTSSGSFWCGTSGLVLPFNKAEYPAEFKDKSRLHYYASQFNSIEFNNTFYKLPQVATVDRWAESVPHNFQFTFKVPKSITHAHESPALTDISAFLNVVAHAGTKKGCLLAQFPPSFTLDQREVFKKIIEKFEIEPLYSSWKLAVEFRHPSWQHPDVYKLLKDYNSSSVLHDLNNAPIPRSSLHGNLIYLRLHGPQPRYRGSYTDEFLKHLAQTIISWIKEEKTVYIYFNNTVGDAYNNAKTLKKFVLYNS